LRVGAAYVVASWLVIQVVETIFPAFGYGEAPVRIATVIFAIGLVPMLIIAWAFELTPEGLKKESEVDRSQSITPQTGKRLDRVIMVVLALALGYFAFDKFALSVSREASIAESAREEGRTEALVESFGEKSIAVLPFVDMSSEKDQEYMSDGIAEELLNLLAKVPNLRVISRSSAFSFKGKNLDIPEIARRLNVANILEGSVRKAGNQVRITAQLIDARSDTHLWSETYDRKLDDIFAIQDDISAAIVDSLMARMDLDSVEHTATHGANEEAYTTYLLAQHQWNRRVKDGYIQAKALFQKAIEQDPNYAPPYAQLAILWLLEADGYGAAEVTMKEAIPKANALIDKALALDPELDNAYAARGLAMRFDENTSGAIDEFKKALEINPSNSSARNWLSMAYRSSLRSEDELETLREGHRRDPLATALATNLVKSLSRFGLYDEADQVLEEVKSLSLSAYGFSKSEALMYRGQYARSVEAALRGEEAETGSFVALYTAGYLLAAMGEQTEAATLDPWQGKVDDYQLVMNVEVRDPKKKLEQLNQDGISDEYVWKQYSLLWAYLGVGDFETAEALALQRLEELNEVENEIDGVNLALAIIEWHKGNQERAIEFIEPLDRIMDRNLSAGDNKSLNYLIKAIAEFIRGDETRALEYLAEGFSGKAPMTFEGEDLYSVYAALGWDQRPDFQGLMDGFEAHNRAELVKLFAIACGEPGFTVWQPMPESCEAYAADAIAANTQSAN